MAKSVTSQFLDEVNRKNGAIYIQRVRYKRRYWNGSAYVYEAAYKILDDDTFGKIGPITWVNDFPKLNEFRAQNVALFQLEEGAGDVVVYRAGLDAGGSGALDAAGRFQLGGG